MDAAARHLPLEPTPWRRLLDDASAPYRAAGRFAWHFARGKLRADPVFHHLIAGALIPPRSRVLDIGCGQGLLASLLHASSRMRSAGEWPPGWPPAPADTRVHGIDLAPREIERARTALGGAAAAAFVCADMRHAAFPPSDVVVILDVLHYVGHEEQQSVLRRACEALPPTGRLLLRVADAGVRGRFRLGQWVDRLVARLRGYPAPNAGRPLADWTAQLRALGMQVEAHPMSRRTPFANVLLVARHAARGEEGPA